MCDWLANPICARMMEEQPEWFGLNFGGPCDETCYPNTKEGNIYYLSEHHTHLISLPLHAAWVLQRAEEEMFNTHRIVFQQWPWGVEREDGWRIRYVSGEQNWLIDKVFPSKPLAVLAAYDYLFPEKEEPITVLGTTPGECNCGGKVIGSWQGACSKCGSLYQGDFNPSEVENG